MALWLLVFGLGILVTSQPYRDQLAKAFDWGSLLKAIVTFTPTNVAILSVLAGFLGGCASLLLCLLNAVPGSNGPCGHDVENRSSHSSAPAATFLYLNPVGPHVLGTGTKTGVFGAAGNCRYAQAIVRLIWSPCGDCSLDLVALRSYRPCQCSS